MSKAKPGDSLIPFDQWTRHDEAAEAYFRTKALGQGGSYTSGTRDSNIIKVKNNSGADRAAGHILEFTGFQLTDLTVDIPVIWMTGGSPTLANSFGVLLRAVPSGEIDDCQVHGVCAALVNVIDADDKYARVSASTYLLQSSAIGPARILYKPSGTGEKMCAVLLNDAVGEVLIKNDTGSDIGINSSGTFKIFTGTPGSESDSGQTISAYNKSSVAFKNGKFGSASLLNGQAYAVPWQT